METTETKFRNHISIVIERFGTIFIGIVIVLAGSALDDLKEIVKHMDNLKEYLADEFAGASLFLGLFLIALFWQLRRWAKTYISIQGQAIVIEKIHGTARCRRSASSIFPMSISHRIFWK